jgi:hypothetical protein
MVAWYTVAGSVQVGQIGTTEISHTTRHLPIIADLFTNKNTRMIGNRDETTMTGAGSHRPISASLHLKQLYCHLKGVGPLGFETISTQISH